MSSEYYNKLKNMDINIDDIIGLNEVDSEIIYDLQMLHLVYNNQKGFIAQGDDIDNFIPKELRALVIPEESEKVWDSMNEDYIFKFFIQYWKIYYEDKLGKSPTMSDEQLIKESFSEENLEWMKENGVVK